MVTNRQKDMTGFDKLEKDKDRIDKETKKIEKKINLFSFVAWGFVVMGFIILIMVIIIEDDNLKIGGIKLAEFGSFVGGAVASVWSLAGLIFIYTAILGQKQQLLIQQLDVKINQEDVRINRREIELLEEQFKQQQFVNIFFQLLKVNSTIVESIKIRPSHENTGIILTGRDSFENFYNELVKSVKHSNNETFELAITKYEDFYIKHQIDLNRYFGNLYHIIKFIHQYDTFKYDNFNKGLYTDVVSEQLTSFELVLFFYHGLSKFGKEKFKSLIEEYGILENINDSLLFKKEDLNEYAAIAYKDRF